MTQQRYDVAISFLSADEPIAAALHDRLSDGLDVFFYPRKQEELAGKDGQEVLRTPFLEESCLVVVLYREPWGQTPWTRVEQTAIQDGCLKYGWERHFLMMLDKTSVPPKWLPTTRVRFNYADFGLEQAVGAIKARALELGRIIARPTALKRAELVQQETQYLRERQQLRSAFGRNTVEPAALKLFNRIKEICAEINASRSAVIQFKSDAHQCHLRSRVSMLVTLELYSEPKLLFREFDKRLELPGEFLVYLSGKPCLLCTTSFLPDMNRSREYGWSDETNPSRFLTSDTLADTIVSRFVDLDARSDRGEFVGSNFESGI